MASSFVNAPTQGSSAGTQRGPGTEATSMMIAGVKVQFPCKPYPSQMAMMSKVIQGLKTRKNCLLESPTGSGKSLALLCSALAWQRHEAERVMQYNAEIDARHEAAIDAERMERKKKRQSEDKNQSEAEYTNKHPKNMDSENNGNGKQDQSDSSFDVSTEGSKIPVFDLTDDDDDDFKPSKRSRFSTSSNLNRSNFTSDSSGDADTLKESVTINKRTKPQEMEDSPYFVPAEKKLTVPKIFFGTRTHKQIAQITRELRKTGYKNVRSVILASREHTCINPTVEKLPNKNEACRELLQNAFTGKGGCIWHSGARKLANFGALSNAGLSPAYDVEDLVLIGRKHKACPYYVTRFLLQNADIIFCPYNYMIDSNIRKTMNLELEGHVVIFDEAHNMEDAARESSNISLKQDDIQRAMQDCEKIGRLGNEPYAHAEISKMLSLMSQWMDTQTPELRENTFNSSGKCWTGTDFLGSIQASGLDEENIKMQLTYFVAISAQRDAQIEAEKERGSRRVNEKPVITAQSLATIENVFKLFEVLYKDNGRHRGDFRVAMSKDTVRGRRDGNTGPMRTFQVLSLHLWCLNSAVAFEFLKLSVHSIVLTSGTLSPMQSFESELDTPFPLKLEANHVINKSQCWAAVVGTGPNGGNLNGAYANASTLKYQDEIGSIVLRVCQIMPHGVLCFFPSYKMLENLTTRWKTTGLLNQIEAVKTVVLEPRSGPAMFQEAMDTFYEAVDVSNSDNNTSMTGQTGALFLAVCRGKVSEGLDFADHNARAVICVGIPFPNVRDMQVELKRDYNNKNTSRGLLAGGEWYEIQAFRALNQALGRCIRHRNDWGAILLVDDRYIRTPRYVNCLSKWIRSSVQSFNNWKSLEGSMEGFRDGMLSVKYEPLTFDGDNSMNSDEQFPLGGAGDLTSPVLGMNNDVKGHGKPSYSGTKENSTSAIMPFANSFSSGGDLDNVFPSNDDQCASESKPVNDSCPSTPNTDEIEKSPRSEFKTPATPLSTFSRKRNQHNNKNEKPNRIATLFANAVEKNNARTAEFNPSQVSVGNFSSPGPSENTTNTSGTKRPRQNKIRM